LSPVLNSYLTEITVTEISRCWTDRQRKWKTGSSQRRLCVCRRLSNSLILTV